MADLLSDEAVVAAVRQYLAEVFDLDSVTLNSVKGALETKLGCDLGERRELLKQALREYIESMQEPEEEELAAAVAAAAAGDGDDDDDEGLAGEGEGRSKRKRGSGKSPGGGGRKGGGFAALVTLSVELAEFTGETMLGRTEVTKRIWAYIKENELQNPKDRREILCDEKLSKVLKCKKINMMKMTAVLSKQMFSAKDLQEGRDDDSSDDEGAEADAAHQKKKAKAAEKKRAVVSKENAAAKKKSKSSSKVKKEGGGGKKTGFNVPLLLSPKLAALMGTPAMGRSEIVKQLWVHIRQHELQNPHDKREILLDAPLKAVFGVESMTMFSMNKLLVPHVSKLPPDHPLLLADAAAGTASAGAAEVDGDGDEEEEEEDEDDDDDDDDEEEEEEEED